MADEKGMSWWKDTFKGKIDGEKRVDINLFIQGLQAKFDGKVNVGPNKKYWLQAVLQLISNNQLAISEGKFQAFLNRFGPWENSLPKAISNLYVKPGLPQPWFHSFMTREEVKKTLHDKPVGSFLVRFSNSNPNDLVLSFIRVKGGAVSPKNIVIANCEKGYMFKGEKIAPFASITALIDTWGAKVVEGKKRLNEPIKTDLYIKLAAQEAAAKEDNNSMYSVWDDGGIGDFADSGGDALRGNFE